MSIKVMGHVDQILVIAPFVPTSRERELRRLFSCEVTSLSSRKKLLAYLYKAVERNEAMLWAISWLMEVLFRANSSCLRNNVLSNAGNKTVNISYTLPIRCNLFWNQATPPLQTLRLMGKSNLIARIIAMFFSSMISRLDLKLRSMHYAISSTFANNSEYLKQLYDSLGWPSKLVLNVPKQYYQLPETEREPTRDYVLAYVGKETEIDTLLKMAKQGIRLVCFGAKIPIGTSVKELKENVDFRGFVPDKQLAILYHNALFTAFPFTEEPFGWVPLESMYYGTPVLSYNKQGPAETIIDQKTGWLVETPEDFVEMALVLWKSGKVSIDVNDCRKRAEFFSFERTRVKVEQIMKGSLDQ